MSKRVVYSHIKPQMQRKIAKMGRMASGAGKTINSTQNYNKKEIARHY